jgi:radical SAM superfamily enzyme YgiQ (UPF0313 family)
MTATPRLGQDGSILLISCYEMGHQPLGLAGPSGHLRRAGYAPTLIDLSQESLNGDAVTRAAFVGICVPMHTALVMGARMARRIRESGSQAHICFFGLYAGLNAAYLLRELGDSVITGDPEAVLPLWIAALDGTESTDELAPLPGVSTRERAAAAPLARPSGILPDRTGLPPLEAYVRLERAGQTELAGYVEATRGCKYLCLHCPIPPVFGGRFTAVPRDAVLADIRQQVAAGARHITFGDPDFLNGPGHALALVRALHAEWPSLGYDFTAKVEHLIRHAALLPEFAATGCRFIVSAVESLSDTVLWNLDKGHTRHDVQQALALTRDAGIPLRPSLMPFTPWSTLPDYLELLDWIEQERLVRHVDPIQLAIRLLVPPGSALLGTPQFEPHRGALHAEGFTWRWTHPDRAMDALQREVMAIVEGATARGDAPDAMFSAIRVAARRAAGLDSGAAVPMAPPPEWDVPRLTEPWFC